VILHGNLVRAISRWTLEFPGVHERVELLGLRSTPCGIFAVLEAVAVCPTQVRHRGLRPAAIELGHLTGKEFDKCFRLEKMTYSEEQSSGK
jgi:hypothetical protein